MRILVIGGGGREHAILHSLAPAPKVELFACPGNGGISQIAQCFPIPPDDINSLLKFAREKKIDLTIVGPELPLALGIVDAFEKEGLLIFGPNKNAARLEADKGFAREFMRRHNIPSPDFFIAQDPESAIECARDFLRKSPYSACLIKASGLAFGKGAFVLKSFNEIEKTVDDLMRKKVLGPAGEKLVIEEYLPGEEASLIAFTDSETILSCLPSQDHKRLYDNDEGPNTGGMGAYAPAPLVNEEIRKRTDEEVFLRFLKGLKEEGIIYKGIIYAGIIVSNNQPYVLEFNCRFGDPETQAILPLLRRDLLEICLRTIEGSLKGVKLAWEEGYALNVVLAAKGYPGNYEKGKMIKIPEEYENAIIFHAGTERRDNQFFTAGGRVISVTGLGKTLAEAKKNAYKVADKIEFEGKHLRRDIGDKGIKRLNEAGKMA
uniref:Phosphoribosylamine--glycine ligase n=1 Tax=candidate division WOR-3 bacterium TaxID=2052148 RepID=A0A7C3YSI0_UNCW3